MRIKILIWNQNWGSTYVVTHHYMYIPILASHLFVQICMKKLYLWKHEPTAASKWDSIKLERRQLVVKYKFLVLVGGSGEQYTWKHCTSGCVKMRQHIIGRDIHIECSKQFKWNSYFYVSGQRRSFWAALKLL